ncbi:nuclease-related domain-containing protein [Pseudogulbenkiania subflava]|uniref:Nuclease-related domain-containing protein n=1 Tax=Pseudogulbenkiania subflava DSM 22618 TaxID=1123014 RepID=A0A1Y6B6P6_9NEIS|nr:nuclease-related domain-containing protein [Pseudogulbenkiania subflava]SME94985.1 Nuclease-related domain-containing protein [Pseudogulbenkiania subflava DSM 22618]
MILKDKAATEPKDKFQAAGDAAEREMAFYLKRYFSDDPDVFVLHDIRIEFNDDVAQMDHLVIHAAGMTIVETKSVAGRVQMKEDGQWLRWYGDRSSGMASPLIQAKLQMELLRKFLRANTRQPEAIDRLPIDFLVAISSQGVYIPPKSNPPPEVCKTDLVGEKLRVKMVDVLAWFSESHRKLLADFLLRSHTPREAPASGPVSAPAVVATAEPVAQEAYAVYQAEPVKAKTTPVTRTAPEHLEYIGDRLKATGLSRFGGGSDGLRKVYATYCKKCASQNLEFRYGKYGYYFKCLDCEENTSVKLDCRLCHRQTKLRKEGELLFVECAHCRLSEVLHRNDRPLPELEN